MTTKLNWEKSGERWVKMIRGERFTSTKNIGIREANKEFDGWFQATFGASLERAEEMRTAQDATTKIMGTMGLKPKKKDPTLPASLNRRPPLESQIFNAVVASPQHTEANELAVLIKQFLEFKGSQLKPDSLVPVRSHLVILKDEMPVAEPTINQWEEFCKKLNTWKREGKLSAKYCSSILTSTRAFFDWAKPRIKVPAFIFDKKYSISIPKKRPAFYSEEELAALLKASDEQMATIIRLCLNTSMTQADISEATWDMIDLKAGTLTRMRTKHEHRGDDESVLIVVYSLWKEILTYLKKLNPRNNKTGLVFTREDGTKLVQEKRNDQIAVRFNRIREAAGVKKSFKYLRKTGSTALGSKLEYRVWREVYLANSPKEVTDVNYDGTVTLPKEVTEYIRTRLGI